MTEQVYVLGKREPVQVDTHCKGHDCPAHGVWWHNALECIHPSSSWCAWCSPDELQRQKNSLA